MTIDARILRGPHAPVRRRPLPVAEPQASHAAGVLPSSADAMTGSAALAARAPEPARAGDEAAHHAAKAEGYAVGYREGHAEAARRCEEQLDLARCSVREEAERLQRQRDERAQQEARLIAELQRSLMQAVAQRLAELEPQAIELAFTALCKVLGPDTERASLLSGLIRQAMTQMRSAKCVTIHLNPASLALIESRCAKLAEETACAGVEWIADATLPLTGCTLASDQGQLDAALQTQLDSLRALWSAADSGAAS
jgi:flagellar assembly protein FliH